MTIVSHLQKKLCHRRRARVIQHMPGRELHTFVTRQPADIEAIVVNPNDKIVGMKDKLSRNTGRDAKRNLIGAQRRPDSYIGRAHFSGKINHFGPDGIWL